MYISPFSIDLFTWTKTKNEKVHMDEIKNTYIIVNFKFCNFLIFNFVPLEFFVFGFGLCNIVRDYRKDHLNFKLCYLDAFNFVLYTFFIFGFGL